VEEGTTFDLQAASYEGSCVGSIWTGRCDANGFLYVGQIDPITEGDLGWLVSIQSSITVLLEVTEQARITSARIADGTLSPAVPTVTLSLEDGTTDVLLGADPAVDEAERLLEPGIHRITFSIDVYDYLYIPISYSGLVEVRWDAPVEVEGSTWGGVKCLFRDGP